MEGAIDPNPDLGSFMQRFNPPFPVGIANNVAALGYMEISPMVRSFVPFMVFIDRQGVIRAQFTGGDQGFFAEKMDENIREQALKLLNEPSAANKPKRKKAS